LENGGLIFDVDHQIINHEKRVIYTEKTIEKAAELVRQVGQMDRAKVRKVFEDNFSVKVMTNGYQKIYEDLIKSKDEEKNSSHHQKHESQHPKSTKSLKLHHSRK